MSSPFYHPVTSATAALETVPIDSSSASVTVHAVPAGRRLLVYDFYVESAAGGTIALEKGANPLTGPLVLGAGEHFSVRGAGFPVFVLGDGEDLVIDNPGPVALGGYATIAEVSA